MTDAQIRLIYLGAFEFYCQNEIKSGRIPNNDGAFIAGVRAVLAYQNNHSTVAET